MTPITFGIDPGSMSWDFIALDDDKIILDTSISTKKILEDPDRVITIIDSLNNKKKIDLMVAPSGFGLPLKNINDLTEKDIFLTLLKFNTQDKEKLVGLGEILKIIKNKNIPGVIVPSVKHLPTVPRFRKINKIDMGTADKLCTAVIGIKDQTEKFQIPPEESKFIMVEIGYAFSAVLAIENGQIIDGIGGSNIMGFRACGSLDGELAYLIGDIKKNNIYKGGVAYISGDSNLSLKEIMILAEKDDHINCAFKSYISSVEKAVFGISSSFTNRNNIKEILLAGRGAENNYLRKNIIDSLNTIAPVRLMKSYTQIAKRAAQGAAFIANGLLEGKSKSIVDNLKIKESSGSILDDIYVPFNKERFNSDVN
ncbi:MAG: DUF1464 family protein [Candidatus Lokiarchaeota archaeon]|nr:DUF1464 family protein [Candidatus Lokiarchaeota archaeon]